MKKRKPIKISIVPEAAKSSEQEMPETGLRILARIIARRHLERIHSKQALTKGDDSLR